MAKNYKKSGAQALVVVHTQDVKAGGFHIIGKQLGVVLTDGIIGEEIAVSLDGVWLLKCGGGAVTPGTPLHFSINDLELYSGAVVPADFENVAISWDDKGAAGDEIYAKINAHIAVVVAAP